MVISARLCVCSTSTHYMSSYEPKKKKKCILIHCHNPKSDADRVRLIQIKIDVFTLWVCSNFDQQGAAPPVADASILGLGGGGPVVASAMDHTNTYDPAAGQHSFMNHTGHMMLPSGAAYGSAQPERGAMRTLFGDLDRSAGPMLDGGSGGPLRGLYPSPPFACRPADRGFYPYPSYLPQQYGPRVPTPFPGPRQPRPDPGARAESDAAAQRRRDVQWVEAFTRDRPHHHPLSSGGPGKSPGPDLKLMVCRAAQLIDQLEGLCGDLRTHVGDPGVWTDAHVRAMDVRKELEDAFAAIDGVDVDAWKTKMRRRSGRRTRKHRLEAERRRRERISEKEAAIDAWRLRHIRGVEEKKKVQRSNMVSASSAWRILPPTYVFYMVCIPGTGAEAGC